MRKHPRPPFHHKDSGLPRQPGQHQQHQGGHRQPAPPRMRPYEEFLPDTPQDEPEESAKHEAEYLRHLADEHVPIIVRLKTGEEFRGHIEYYDRRFIRLTRPDGPNLFIYKQDIKYVAEEA